MTFSKPMLKLSSFTGGHGVQNVGVGSNINSAAVDKYSCAPLASRCRYSSVAATAQCVADFVFRVRAACNITQIANRIIQSIAVNVINGFSRPCAVMNGPRNSVGVQRHAFKFPVQITTALFAHPFRYGRHGRFAGHVRVMPVGSVNMLPRHDPGLRVVSNELAQFVRGWYRAFSHSELILRCGQGLALLTQRLRPVFSSKPAAFPQGVSRTERCGRAYIVATGFQDWVRGLQ